MKGLKGKRIVVAGAATGIGAATAKRLAEEGAKVVAGDINTAGVEATVAAITKAGGTAKAVHFDLANEDTCKALIQTCVDSYGGIDGLANVGADLSPALSSRDRDLLTTTDDVWDRYIDVNFMGYKRTMRAALPHMLKQKNGAIVSVSSAAAHIGEEVRMAYASSKIALHALTRHVARRWGPDNIRCNAVAPGPVMSEIFKANIAKEDLDKMNAAMPLRRSGDPAEVGSIIAFLLSDDGDWVTGQVWSVNGGWTLRE
jgi:NAD(P)-dependent dehydrogenase (short-subunit alcohol dehydrogenase family)